MRLQQPLLMHFWRLTFYITLVGGLQHRQGHGHSAYGQRHRNVQQESWAKYRSNQQPFYDQVPFDHETGEGGRNITTVEGGTAILSCIVRNLGNNNTVSWIRKGRHPVVLSSGRAVFTSDRRVSVTHPSGHPDTWQLAIDPVLDKDEGLYECQVNTRDKMSLVFKLNVQPAQAQLTGESNVYVKAGSTISLTCAINLYSVPPPDITWYHGRRILRLGSPRGGISLETEKSRTGTVSKLLVTEATTRDSGNYTCFPSRGESVSANVHVITDEQQFELRDGQNSGGCSQFQVPRSQVKSKLQMFFNFMLLTSLNLLWKSYSLL